MKRLLLGLLLLCVLISASSQTSRIGSRPLPTPAPMPLPIAVQPSDDQAVLESAQVAIDLSGVALTTAVDLTVMNPQSVVREATVNFPLAPGEQMARFALDINGVMRNAVAVEKIRGREVFEAIERRRVDPALLEKTEGDNFRLRIFPVTPHGTRKARVELVQIAATQELKIAPPSATLLSARNVEVHLHVSGDTPPLVKLAGRPVKVVAEVGGFGARVDASVWSADTPIVVTREAARMARAAIDDSPSGHWLLADVPVAIGSATRKVTGPVQLLWDSSASHDKASAELEIGELDAYFKAMGNGEVRLQRLRNHADPVEHYSVVRGNWDELREALRHTVYDGATALSDFNVAPDVSEVLLVSDGLSNYDVHEFPKLPAGQRLFALSAAQQANRDFLNAVSTENGGSFTFIDASQRSGAAAKALLIDVPQIRLGATDGVQDAVIDTSAIGTGHIQVAARLLRAEGSINLHLQSGRSSSDVSIPFDDMTPRQHDLAVFWARFRIAQLAATPDHKAEVRRIGEHLQVATDETSLIVLESPSDYVQYGVTPPPELAAVVGQLNAVQAQSAAGLQAAHLDSMLRDLAEKKAWYDAPLKAKAEVKPKTSGFEPRQSIVEPLPMASPAMQNAAPIAPPAAPAPVRAAPSGESLDESRDRALVSGKALRRADTETPSPVQVFTPGEGAGDALAAAKKSDGSGHPEDAGNVIRLQAYVPDSAYGARLRAASAQDLYAVYLDERPDFDKSPALYLDAADLLLARGQRDLALRVLSNLAELDLSNRQVLRVLGYRLLQAGDADTAVRIFKQVRDLAPNEPQSFRDLGLADAAANHDQDAVNDFAEVLLKPWDGRSPEIELITLADLNALIARSSASLDVSRIDSRLLVNMPLDVRAVLAWDADNSDLDLWVTDPKGEVCIYSHRFTAIGGRMSKDVTQGYGPEEFSLKKAIPGHYKIEVNYFGANAQLVSGVITATVRLTTGFGGKHPTEKMLTVRLHKASDRVMIGEFDVAP